MTNNPLVSIIIPLYNSKKFIKKCVESCLEQSYKNIEVIVIDDGSTDGGSDTIDLIAKKHKQLKVIHTKNNGVSSARNTGLKQSNGEYVCFVDADDFLENNFVEQMINNMLLNNSDYCIAEKKYEKGKSNQRFCRVLTTSEARTLLLSQKISVGCWNKMFSKDIFKHIKFNEDLFYGEGLFLINEAAGVAQKITYCDGGLYHYRKVNPKSATKKFNINKMINGEKSLFKIKNLIKDDGKKTNRMWAQHYCLFCANAANGLIKDDKTNKDYLKWCKKARKYVLEALLSEGHLKTKIRIIISLFCPKVFIRIKK